LLKKVVLVKDLCDTVEYLINNDSITGQVVAVDSGQNLSWVKKSEKE
jgi:enoyl-[acyl-carrier-protein] reductase (NADH)